MSLAFLSTLVLNSLKAVESTLVAKSSSTPSSEFFNAVVSEVSCVI